VTFDLIRSAAERAAALAARTEPVTGRTYRVEVEFDAAHLAAATALVPTVRRTDTRRVAFTADTAFTMIRTFKTVTTVAAAAREADYG
jgi:D-amino peptidase